MEPGLRRRMAAAAMMLALAGAGTVQAQQPGAGRALSLAEAVRLAEGTSEQLAIARAAVQRGQGEVLRARSELLPQINATASYSRLLKSQFSGLSFSFPGDTTGGGFGDLPFGQENTYNLGLSFSENVFSGGRLLAQRRVAQATRTSAEIALRSARAQLVLEVTEAYFDAALSDRLVEIADSTLAQAERTLEQTRVARRVGNSSEFEQLRAQVARDNQRPVVIRQRADRDLAYLRLRQLLHLPLEEPLLLATGLQDSIPGLATLAGAEEETALADTSALARAGVRQASEAVRVQEGLLRVTRAQRLPSVYLTSQYGGVAYPRDELPGSNDFRANWTVGASVSLPLLTGGRIRGEELAAEAGVTEARARLQQAQQLARIDARGALQRLEAAQATWEASAGTVEQAERAYQIAELRYREGLSTQTELADARLLLQQAQANRALAVRDLQVARTRVALLRDLPLTIPGADASGAAQDPSSSSGRQRPASPSQPAPTGAGQSSFPGAGIP